jgi:hypothetical protein
MKKRTCFHSSVDTKEINVTNGTFTAMLHETSHNINGYGKINFDNWHKELGTLQAGRSRFRLEFFALWLPGSTHPLTEMSTGSISEGVIMRMTNNLETIKCQMSRNSWSLRLLESYVPVQACIEMALTYSLKLAKTGHGPRSMLFGFYLCCSM